MARAVENGAKLQRDCEVTGIDLDSGNIAAVETTKGKIATRIAVNAAGAWAASVAKFAGIDLPVEPYGRMLVPTEPSTNSPTPLP